MGPPGPPGPPVICVPTTWSELSSTGPIGIPSVAKATDFVPIPSNPNYAVAVYQITNSHIYIVDISNPSAISFVSPTTNTVGIPNTIQGFRIVGNYFYIVNNIGELFVINVTTPTAITLAGSIHVTASGDLWDVDVQPFGADLRAYVTGFNSPALGLYVVDVTNPAAMVVLGHAGMSVSLAVRVVGNYAYVGNFSANTLDVYNISTGVPSLVTSLPIPFAPGGMNLLGTTLFLASETSALLMAISIATPTAPVLTASLTTSGMYPNHAVLPIVNDQWLIQTTDTGIIDSWFVGTPMSPVLESSFNTGLGNVVNISASPTSFLLYFPVRVGGGTAADNFQTWALSSCTPTIPFSPLTPADWAAPPPTSLEAAINRLAAAVEGLLGHPIP